MSLKLCYKRHKSKIKEEVRVNTKKERHQERERKVLKFLSGWLWVCDMVVLRMEGLVVEVNTWEGLLVVSKP